MMIVNFACPVSGGDVDPDDKKSSLAHPAAAASHHDETHGDPFPAHGNLLPFPRSMSPENLTLPEFFTFSEDVMRVRGFTCVGERLLRAVWQEARGNLFTMTPFCPWDAPVCMDPEAINLLAQNPMTQLLGEHLKKSDSSKRAVQCFAYFPRMLSSHQDLQMPCIIMVERAFQEGDATVSAAAIEDFLESVRALDGLLEASPVRDDELRKRVFSEPRKTYICQELEFLTGIDVSGRGLSDEVKKVYMHLSAYWGFARAQLALGLMYELLRPLDGQNWREAARWYQLAAAQGFVPAQFGLMHLHWMNDVDD